MKRKAIEKIPYLTLPKVVRKRTAKYVGVTALQEIAGEQHLLLEVSHAVNAGVSRTSDGKAGSPTNPSLSIWKKNQGKEISERVRCAGHAGSTSARERSTESRKEKFICSSDRNTKRLEWY